MPCPRAILLLLVLLPSVLAAATVRVEGESFSQLSFEQYVTPMGGEWFRFDGVNFAGATAVVLNAARQGPAVMEFRLGSPTGTKIGQVTVDTGGWRTFQDHSVAISGVSGTQALYVVATGASATAQAVCRSLRLTGTAFNRTAITADAMAASLRDRDHYFVALQGNWARYPARDLGTGVTALRARVANGSTGTLTLRRDSATGPVIGTFTIATTAWRTFATYTAALAGGSHTGVHDLYLVGGGSHGGVVDWFEFDTGGAAAPAFPAYTADRSIVAGRMDGAFRPVVGVHEHALFRPTRNPAAAPSPGKAVLATIFNHAPMLTWWNNRFWVLWHGTAYVGTKPNISVPVFLAWSDDGRTWSTPVQAFTPKTIGSELTNSHHRMGFYIAGNGRLLCSTFMGPYPPNKGTGGYARIVREITGPGTFGPVHAIRYNTATGWNATNTGYPHYSASADAGFKAACDELYNDRLARQAWVEEDSSYNDASYFTVPGQGDNAAFEGKAFNWYRLADQRIVGMWKDGWMGISRGAAWTPGQVDMDQDMDRFAEHRRAKMWGEPLTTGRYAMFFDRGALVPGAPSGASDVRTPLVVSTSADGITYDTRYLNVSGDPGPQLFRNTGDVDNKTVGASYVRGITWLADRQNRARPSEHVWISYSTNKEFIWATEVPKDMAATVGAHVDDDLGAMTAGGRVGMWNIRDGGWTPVRLVADGGTTVLRLADRDRYDYAKAFRVFPASAGVRITTRVRPQQSAGGDLHIELVEATGKRPVRLRFGADARLSRQDAAGTWQQLAGYAAAAWYDLVITCDAAAGTFGVTLNGTAVGTALPVAEAAATVERVEFRTGDWRLTDFSTNGFGAGTPGYRSTDLANADDPLTEVRFDIARLRSEALGGASPPPVDTTPPATPAAPQTSSTTGPVVTLSGTAEPGAAISIRDHGVQIATASADGSGQWSITLTLAPGSHQLTVVASDATGNSSAASPATAVTVPPGGSPPPTAASEPTSGASCGAGSGIAVFVLLALGALIGLRRVREETP